MGSPTWLGVVDMFFGPTWVGSSQLDPVVNNHGTTTHWDDPPSSEEYLGSSKVANESLGWDSPLKMESPLSSRDNWVYP